MLEFLAGLVADVLWFIPGSRRGWGSLVVIAALTLAFVLVVVLIVP